MALKIAFICLIYILMKLLDPNINSYLILKTISIK